MYIFQKEYDPSNLVYLFAATLEWDDTRCYGLDLFVVSYAQFEPWKAS